jgi:hypothetical protein
MIDSILEAHIVWKQISFYSPIPLPASCLLQQLLRFFFKPVQLHFQLADLTIKLGDQLLLVFVPLFPSFSKKIRKALQKLLSPVADLVGMNTKFTGQLSQGFLPFYCLQDDFGSKCGVITLSHVDHFTIAPPRLWQVKMHLIALSSFWGDVHTPQKPCILDFNFPYNLSYIYNIINKLLRSLEFFSGP